MDARAATRQTLDGAVLDGLLRTMTGLRSLEAAHPDWALVGWSRLYEMLQALPGTMESVSARVRALEEGSRASPQSDFEVRPNFLLGFARCGADLH